MKTATLLLTTAFCAFAQAPAAKDALDALRSVKTATDVGVNVSDYAARVIDAKRIVDPYLESKSSDDAQLHDNIALVAKLYVLAGRSWAAKITKDTITGDEVGEAILADAVISAYRPMTQLIREAQEHNRKDPAYSVAWYLGNVTLSFSTPQIFWAAAAIKLEESVKMVK